MTGITGPVVVTGTDTGVGKTIVTAAIAAAARAAGRRVAVLKPAQTGGDDDALTVGLLASPDKVVTLVRYPEPLAPLAAARQAKAPPLPLDAVLDTVRGLTEDAELVLVEGAGGLLVPMGAAGWTVADLCAELAAPAVVVVRAGLGTLNHTALTLEALGHRGIDPHVVIGAWPAEPEAVHGLNLSDLSTMAGGLAGVVPEGSGSLSPEEFRERAPGWLTATLGGRAVW